MLIRLIVCLLLLPVIVFGQSQSKKSEAGAERAEAKYEYKLLATSGTGTMQKEISAEGRNGFALVGLTVAKTAFGGSEVVAILRRVK